MDRIWSWAVQLGSAADPALALASDEQLSVAMGSVWAAEIGFVLGWLVVPIKPGRVVDPQVLKGEAFNTDGDGFSTSPRIVWLKCLSAPIGEKGARS
ncbi:MAG TPA: hypothetical protein VI541_01585 [Actinomycetota bacterium]|nr:hypothetical protein [Actinomycetota bacterium]